MANTYVYLGPGERWAVEEATAEDKMNVARQNNDYLYEALNTIMDADAADGIVIGTFAPTGNVTMLDGMWIGLGAAAGRLGFSDAAPDTVAVEGAKFVVPGTYLLPLQVGTKRLWHDATDDVFRVLTGSDPISEDDGDALQEGELF